MSTSAPAIDIRRIAGYIGAEVTGVRIAADLPGDVFSSIRHALGEHKVIFFRGQHHLTDTEQASPPDPGRSGPGPPLAVTGSALSRMCVQRIHL